VSFRIDDASVWDTTSRGPASPNPGQHPVLDYGRRRQGRGRRVDRPARRPGRPR
jgi:hypothetical protein